MLSDEHSCPVLAAALSNSLPVCVCLCVCVSECHPHSAPLKRKASPQRSLRQLHPTTWSLTTCLPITLCHISDFCLHIGILVEFLPFILCVCVWGGFLSHHGQIFTLSLE